MSAPSRLVDRALADAGLEPWLTWRLRGDLRTPEAELAGAELDRALAARIPSLDILLLGALADRVRRAECGERVRIFLRRPSGLAKGNDAVAVASLPAFDPVAGGIAFLREVARARLLGPPSARVRIDVGDVGLPLSQVCLSFGASELVAPPRHRSLTRPSATAPGETSPEELSHAVLHEREMGALVIAAGRTPVIVVSDGERGLEDGPGVIRERAIDEHTAAKKKFRAPGRDRDVSSGGDPS